MLSPCFLVPSSTVYSACTPYYSSRHPFPDFGLTRLLKVDALISYMENNTATFSTIKRRVHKTEEVSFQERASRGDPHSSLAFKDSASRGDPHSPHSPARTCDT